MRCDEFGVVDRAERGQPIAVVSGFGLAFRDSCEAAELFDRPIRQGFVILSGHGIEPLLHVVIKIQNEGAHDRHISGDEQAFKNQSARSRSAFMRAATFLWRASID